jgi:hypothetical protein
MAMTVARRGLVTVIVPAVCVLLMLLAVANSAENRGHVGNTCDPNRSVPIAFA